MKEIKQVENFVGYGVAYGDGKRTYPVIDGVAYTDSFTRIKGDYDVRFNGKYNECYWNEVHLGDDCGLTEVTLEADWGSEELIQELEGLRLYFETKNSPEGLATIGITSKRIEDFSVSYGNASEATRSEIMTLRTTYAPYIRTVLNIDYSGGGVDVW